MSTAELSCVQSFLRPLCYVKAVWEGSSGLADDMYHIIAGKMMEYQRPRPDVVHIAHAYATRAHMEGVSHEACIDDWLREYNGRATNTQHISYVEAKVIKILPLQTPSLQQKIAYHWQDFKIEESGLPYGHLSTDAWLYGTKPRVAANALWSLIQAASPEKRQLSVQRKIGVSLKGLTDAMRLRKKRSLSQSSGWVLP